MIGKPAHNLTNPIKIPAFLDRICPLTKIARHFFKPLVRIHEPLPDERLDHGLPEDGPVRLPVDHFIANHVVTKLAQRLEAFGFRKR